VIRILVAASQEYVNTYLIRRVEDRGTPYRPTQFHYEDKLTQGSLTLLGIGLYTILPSPIWYGVWHPKAGSVGGTYIAKWACNSIAIG